MTLAQAVADALPLLRAEAEARMTDEVEFRANDGTESFDSDTGEYVTSPGTLIYAGRCRVQIADAIPRDVAVGEQLVAIERTVIHIPWSAPAIPVNAVGVITAVGEASGAVLSARYRVTGTHAKTDKTASRVPCEQVSP